MTIESRPIDAKTLSDKIHEKRLTTARQWCEAKNDLKNELGYSHIWCRLNAIEDILGDEYDLARLRALVQADRDGRCVVLSEPMVPMVQIPGDTDVYCPNFGKTLSGGWPLAEADDYRKLCQCPNCGQAIDDTKCEIVCEVTRGEKHG